MKYKEVEGIDLDGNPTTFKILLEERNTMLEQIKKSEDLTRPIWNKVTFKDGTVHELAVANEEGTLVFRDCVWPDWVEFDENVSNNWETSTGKKKLEEWWNENAPEWLKENYDVTIPEIFEVLSDEELPNSLKGKNKQWDIFKDWHNIPHALYGRKHATWWWTKTAYAGGAYYVWYVYPGGSVYNNIAHSTNGFVPACIIKKSA